MMGLRASRMCVLVTLLCCWQYVASDTIVIEKVTCVKPATGIDGHGRAIAAAFGSLVAGAAASAGGAAALIGSGGALIGTIPLTAAAIAKAAGSGSAAGVAALEFLDKYGSGGDAGGDDLVMQINNIKVWPKEELHGYIKAGETNSLEPNIRFDFDGSCKIHFAEYDSITDHDNLGAIHVDADVSPGHDYRIKRAIMLGPESEGDVYEVTYRVERNSRGKESKYVVCGTAFCKECVNDDCCKKTTNSGLDRDEETWDLLKCPPGFSKRGSKRFHQNIVSDVYLRICGNQYTSKKSTNSCSHKHKWV